MLLSLLLSIITYYFFFYPPLTSTCFFLFGLFIDPLSLLWRACNTSLTAIQSCGPVKYKSLPFFCSFSSSSLHRKRERRSQTSHTSRATSWEWPACLCCADCHLHFVHGIDWSFDPHSIPAPQASSLLLSFLHHLSSSMSPQNVQTDSRERKETFYISVSHLVGQRLCSSYQ